MSKTRQTIDLLTLRGSKNADGVYMTELNELGHVTRCNGTVAPPIAKAGYGVGCEYIKTDAVGGQCTLWRNHGTAASSAFRPVGPVMGYGFNLASTKVFVSGTAGLIETLFAKIVSTDIALAAHATSDDSDQLVSVITGTNTVTITNSADPLAAHSAQYAIMRSGCAPEYDIVAAGTHTTVGGAAAEAITITGALATDIALVTYSATNDTDVITKAVMTANTLTVTMSADPSTAHGIHYCILRPRGSFQPTHYVFAAGKVTTAGGAAAEAITVAGALATDVAIVNYAVTDDTDSILKAVVTAGVLTVTASADPGVAHAYSYAVLRAY